MKIEIEKFSIACSRCRQNFKFGDCAEYHKNSTEYWQNTTRILAEIRAARAERLFMLF